MPRISERRACRVLAVARSEVRRGAGPGRRRPARINEGLAAWIAALIQRHPTFGYRRLWALLRFRDGQRVTPKTIYRICALKGWFVHQRQPTPRPRVQGRISQAARSNERWAMDLTHVYCGRDGWAHLAAVIDCHDRELVGHEFALRGRANEAERALEEACLERFGMLRPTGATPVVRSDNGLIYQSRRFRGGVSRLSAHAGVHHALHAGAERDDRALLPQLEGGVRLAAQLRQLRARPARGERVDPLVQRGAPWHGAGARPRGWCGSSRTSSRGLLAR
jgi:Integrase core domain/HTH-like domain